MLLKQSFLILMCDLSELAKHTIQGRHKRYY